MRVREYAGPLGVLAVGIFGFSLLCSVSALATSDLNSHSLKAREPLNIVDLAVANLSTSAALTQQAVAAFVFTTTTAPTAEASFTPTPLPAVTFTVPASMTPSQPVRTRRAHAADPARPLPTQTRTPVPAATSTPLPPPTNTDPPPTDTPLPPPADTEPPPTNTSPPPADTEPPATNPPIQDSNITPVSP